MRSNPNIDFANIFALMPEPSVILSADFIICAVNDAYLTMAGARRENLVGRPAFEVFPGGDDADDNGPDLMLQSFRRVLDFGVTDSMWLQRYDIVDPAKSDSHSVRYWNIKNSPIFGSDGKVEFIFNRGQDVSDVRADLQRVLELFRTGVVADPMGEPDADQVRRFSEFSATSLQGSAMLRELSEEVAQLHHAMESRAQIEQAKGMLMATHQIDENAAFAMLSKESQQTNRKLITICREFVNRASRR